MDKLARIVSVHLLDGSSGAMDMYVILRTGLVELVF